MVSTRRSESSSVAHANGQRYQTRRTNEDRELGSSCDSVNGEQEEEESIEEDSWSSQGKTKIIGVRRFVCSDKKFTRLHLKKLRKRRSRKRVQIYAHKMRDMIDSDDIDECYIPHRSRRNGYSTRRAALSLRPITQKSYKDGDTSTINCNSDDSVASICLRRSKRTRRVNRSWIDVDQMHKIGYPNLHRYSDDDSRDAVVRPKRNGTASSYLFSYQNVEPVEKRAESQDKENKEDNVNRRFLRRSKTDNTQEKSEEKNEEEHDAKKSELESSNNDGANNEEDKASDTKPQQESSSDSDEDQRIGSKRRMRPRKRKLSSSSSEAAVKSYSLRVRRPKPIFEEATRKTIFPRSRFNRRKVISDSDSDSSSPDRRRTNKYSKTPKSPHSHSKNEQMRTGATSLMPISPEALDPKITFKSVGGLREHVQCLKEMVLLPMMYPDVFRQFQIQPSRGVLFHGPPGTGKTLLARALANECSYGSKKVSFFMRKGADVLNKWFGESEKQLRNLFEQAAEMKPSIIFFDEIDGLAPVRSSRQDQVHASIVSTLLALMDGLTNRGEIIVIGATNRIDAIDPALRRPGRFDRELFFPLPAQKEREEILKVHLSQWNNPPSDSLVSYLAESSVGYCGSDLRALCSEAVIQSFRRIYPQAYAADHRLLLDPDNVKVERIDFLRAKSVLVPASHRVSESAGSKLSANVQPLLSHALKEIMSLLSATFPHGSNVNLAKVKIAANVRPALMLLSADGPEHGNSTYLAPALLHEMEHIHSYVLDLGTLFREGGRSPEEACIQIFHEAKRTVPSIIYIPNIDTLWNLASETITGIFITQLKQLGANNPMLILATSDQQHEDLPESLGSLFSTYRNEVYEIKVPEEASRVEFFKPLIIDTCKRPPRPPRTGCVKKLEPLPRAPTPPPAPVPHEVAKKVYEAEESTLRELRIFLRDICRKLASNKMFFLFTKPVDTDEVPDYLTIIKEPMDLETMMTKVDFHRYECARDFLNDIELICRNALEYNPARSSTDRQIRHRACSLRDYAFALIKSEMDSDFEDKCQEIAKTRQQRKTNIVEYLPPYLQTPQDIPSLTNETTNDAKEDVLQNGLNHSARSSPTRKRKSSSWQRGYVKKRKRSQPATRNSSNDNQTTDKPTSDDNSKDQETMEQDETSQTTSPPDLESQNEPALEVPNESHDLMNDANSVVDDLVNPSELLNDPLGFDDLDASLNQSNADTKVNISVSALKEVLKLAASVTKNQPFNSLLDLHFQLSQIIRKYMKTTERQSLPSDLTAELERYKRMHQKNENLSKSMLSKTSEMCISSFSDS